MDEHVKDVARAMTRASDEERMRFPEILAALGQAGIERYHADLVRSTKTYYTPAGGSVEVACDPAPAPAEAFAADGVAAAVRASQAGRIGYREFCRLVSEAGCVGYFVSLAGRRAVYYGRGIDTHTEWFPGARQD